MKVDLLSKAKLRGIMEISPFIQQMGLQITSVNHQDLCLGMTLPMSPGIERLEATGQIHGGPIAALVDTAGCYALIMVAGVPVPTMNFRVDYFRPAIHTDLHAVATVRHAGRSFGLVDINVFADNEKLIAVGRSTFAMPRKPT